MNKKIQSGFTLIELMMVVAILGIVSAIAIPSYSEYVRKAKRADAKVELLRLAQLQESYFVQNLSYAKTLGATTSTAGGLGLGASVTSEQEEYAITMTATAADGSACTGLAASSCGLFTLIATPQGGQLNDKCKIFTYNSAGVKSIQLAAGSNSSDSGLIKKCWK